MPVAGSRAMMVNMWQRLGEAWERISGYWLREYWRKFSGFMTGARVRRLRPLATAAGIIIVTVVGLLIGVAIGARTAADIGPFRAELQVRPAVHGGSDLQIPPLGALSLNSHDGPAHVTVRLGSLDQGRAQKLVSDPNGIQNASATAVTDIENGVIRVVLRTLAVAILGAMILAALVYRRMRRVLAAGVLAMATTVVSFGVAGLTFRPAAIEEPRYEGLLANAPAVVGDARQIANQYEAYRQQLQRMVSNVSRLYTTISTLPVFEPDPSTIRALHVSDLHLNPSAWAVIKTVVDQFDIDVVIDTGDITDFGSQQEASRFVSSIAGLRVPYVYIRGNHDSTIVSTEVARQPNAVVLENEVRSAGGLTFAGIGDPRFTPDKSTSPAGGTTQRTMEEVLGTGGQLADTIKRSGQKVNVAMVHDPASAGGLAGDVPLVLAGHLHERQVRELPAPGGGQPTLLLIEGSTGGAGLRGLEPPTPIPLALSVLYFNGTTKTLSGYDDIKVGGTGLATVTLERHVTKPATPSTSPGATPTPSPS